MDEAEKYKQRIEAIAEKRRLQEEQDRARREEEDEKLRLQQFKRKSLRDKWLMEGAPLSPTFLETQSPHSPPWVTQAQDMEKHIDKSQSENRQLAEEQEKLAKQTEDGQTEAFKVSQAAEEVVSDVAQNGENNSTGSDTTEDDMEVNQRAPLAKSGVVVTNGGENTDFSASDQNNQSLTNGPTSDGVISVEMETNLGVSEADPVKVPNSNVKKEEEEEEEGTLVMRAECIFITDDGDDVPGEVVSQADQQESMQSDKTLLPNPEAGKEGGEAVEEEKVQTQTFTESEKSGAFGNLDDSIKANPGEGGKVKAEDQDKELEEPTCVQSPTSPLESTVVALVPIYTEAQPSNLCPELEAEDSAVAPEEPEVASEPQEATCLPVQFQEVPLTDAQENQRTETGPGEQEPLLLNTKAPSTMVEPAGADSPASLEAQSPTRASQGEVTESPKPKTCHCCSVM